jgi:hypothetical protein
VAGYTEHETGSVILPGIVSIGISTITHDARGPPAVNLCNVSPTPCMFLPSPLLSENEDLRPPPPNKLSLRTTPKCLPSINPDPYQAGTAGA